MRSMIMVLLAFHGRRPEAFLRIFFEYLRKVVLGVESDLPADGFNGEMRLRFQQLLRLPDSQRIQVIDERVSRLLLE